jgi:hypothetical protein
MEQSAVKTLMITGIFALAMGFMESAVVIYLRKIYYPDGFTFPLNAIELNIAITEILRETATIVMLAVAGIAAGKTKTEKFGYFLYCFGIWDIFYYVFLRLLIGWPESFFTWDILFLIPLTWVGPVLAPVINSITMIVFAFLIISHTCKEIKTDINPVEWILLTSGSIVIIIAYTEDYFFFLKSAYSLKEIFSISHSGDFILFSSKYIPANFSWWIFFIGELLLLAGIFKFHHRNKNTRLTRV